MFLCLCNSWVCLRVFLFLFFSFATVFMAGKGDTYFLGLLLGFLLLERQISHRGNRRFNSAMGILYF